MLLIKALILVVSLSCAATHATDPAVARILEKHLDHLYGLETRGDNSLTRRVQEVERLFGHSNHEEQSDGLPGGHFEQLRVQLEELNSAIDKVIAASERSTCKQAVAVWNLFHTAESKINQFNEILKTKCQE